MERFKIKVVIITGGNSGIGYAAAKEFNFITGAEFFIDGGMAL